MCEQLTSKKIYIMLTRFEDNGSRALSIFTRYYYTHSSIGLEEDMDTYYSFVFKRNFLAESITRYIQKNMPLPCRLYEIEVTTEQYQRVKQFLQHFVNNRKQFRYAYIGTLTGLIHIPYKYKYHYYCSQFVAEALTYGNVLDIKQNPATMFPPHIAALEPLKLIYEGSFPDYVKRFVHTD